MSVEGADDPRTAAAIIAAVQAHLHQEACLADRAHAGGRISRWRLALARTSDMPAHGVRGSWRDRDPAAGPIR